MLSLVSLLLEVREDHRIMSYVPIKPYFCQHLRRDISMIIRRSYNREGGRCVKTLRENIVGGASNLKTSERKSFRQFFKFNLNIINLC